MPVTCGLTERQCSVLCTFGFVDYVMFSHNGANWPESKWISYVSSSSPGGVTGGEVCRLRLRLDYCGDHFI